MLVLFFNLLYSDSRIYRDYLNARRVAKELEYITRGLNRNLPAMPPNLSKEESKQVCIYYSQQNIFINRELLN